MTSTLFYQRNYAIHKKLTGATAHEIRTPLSTAYMALDLLTSTISSSSSPVTEISERDNLLDISRTVKEGCDTSLSIVNELLTFEKLSAGMMQLEAKLVPLVPLLESNVSMFRFQAIQKGVDFEVEISDEQREKYKDLMVYVDEHKISQVTRNLLSNALKFTPSQGRVRVHVEVVEGEQQLEMSNHSHSNSPRATESSAISSVSEGCSLIVNTIASLSAEQLLISGKKNSSKKRLTAEIPIETNPSYPKSLSTLNLVFQLMPMTIIYGYVMISVTDSGPGIAAVRTQ